eukprot:scaffold911_cov361-Prasinococcus_capsulatus_cf.AAC.12
MASTFLPWCTQRASRKRTIELKYDARSRMAVAMRFVEQRTTMQHSLPRSTHIIHPHTLACRYAQKGTDFCGLGNAPQVGSLSPRRSAPCWWPGQTRTLRLRSPSRCRQCLACRQPRREGVNSSQY